MRWEGHLPNRMCCHMHFNGMKLNVLGIHMRVLMLLRMDNYTQLLSTFVVSNCSKVNGYSNSESKSSTILSVYND